MLFNGSLSYDVCLASEQSNMSPHESCTNPELQGQAVTDSYVAMGVLKPGSGSVGIPSEVISSIRLLSGEAAAGH